MIELLCDGRKLGDRNRALTCRRRGCGQSDKLLGDGTPVEPVELPTDPESDARIAAQKKKRAAKDPAKTG